MQKTNIETFIKKYNLNGLVDEVCWAVENKTLRVTARTKDRKFMTSIIDKKFDGLPDAEFGIIDSKKLKQMLGILISDDVNLTLVSAEDDPKRIISFVVDDGKSEISHMCAHLDVIPDEPKIKQLPNYEVELVINAEFIERFQAAKKGLSEEVLFTVLTNKKKNTLQLVLGHSRNASHFASIPVFPVNGKDTIKDPISFSSNQLKEILDANSEFKDPILKISEAGLAFIEFDSPEFQCQYYMIKMDPED